MRVPTSWLKEYCNPGLSAAQIAHELAMSGTEPERVVRVGIPSEDGNERFFKIGKVVGTSEHPEAERLSVCSVQLAGSDLRTIVCGAPNVTTGATVFVALPGAILPNGTRLARANIRGVESD